MTDGADHPSDDRLPPRAGSQAGFIRFTPDGVRLEPGLAPRPDDGVEDGDASPACPPLVALHL